MNTSDLFQGKYRTTSHRLREWDYSSEGAYFITICTKNRAHSFGKIKDGVFNENEAARICRDCWFDLPNHFKCALDAFVIMPNHIHGIIFLENNETSETIHVETIHELSLRQQPEQQYKRRNMTIPKIIGRFKMQSAKRINEYLGTQGQSFWQKDYYDHIIRDEDDLNQIREYIIYNPLKWEEDENNLKM